MINKSVKIEDNRWYYSYNIYLNVCAGYYYFLEKLTDFRLANYFGELIR